MWAYRDLSPEPVDYELPLPPTARFIPHTERPQPIGGLEALTKNIIYPSIAREADIEGTVLVQLFIDKTD